MFMVDSKLYETPTQSSLNLAITVISPAVATMIILIAFVVYLMSTYIFMVSEAWVAGDTLRDDSLSASWF